MFKKIQNYLLINHPLLWNTKLVPLTCILIGFQIIFFLLGYSFGALDFNETERNYSFNNDDVVIFFSVLISIIILVIWFVFYFKNNAFKSYYPKNKFSLFKEWGIILFLSFLLSSFIIIYLYGKDVRVRSYFTEKEATNRSKILNEASLFIGDNYEMPEYVEQMVNDSLKRVPLDYVLYNGKHYSLESLFNKKVEGYSFFSMEQDSLTEIKIKNWLVNNKKDSVHSLLKNYMKIAHEHQLKSNLDVNKWFSIVYTYPDFKQTKIIAKFEKDHFGNMQYQDAEYATAVPEGPNGEGYDTINQYVKTIGKEKYVFNKTYVPADALNYNYQKIAEAYTNPTVESDQILITLYFAIGLSLLLFSFKTTSGRSWLIAIVSMGILNILIGILSIVFRSENTFVIALILVTLFLFVYFLVVISRNKDKGISGITLNGLLWLLPAFIPLTYYFILLMSKLACNYRQYQYNENTNVDEMFPKIHYMEANVTTMFYLNIVFIVIMMLFLSIKIKKWKGLAES